MLEQDYLIRILLQFVMAIRDSMIRARHENDPKGAAERIEVAIKDASDIDGDVLLSLAPESIASVMQISGINPQLSEYIARGLLQESQYLKEAGEDTKANVREEQSFAIAKAFGFEMSFDLLTEEEWEAFFSHIEGEK